MDNLDKYEEQTRRQNRGLGCEYCQAAQGHRIACFLLSTPPRELVLTGPAFKEDKYRTLNPEETIEAAVDAVNKYYRNGSPRKAADFAPDAADHLRLRSLGVSWNGDNRE